jgi:DNA-directed RNA polymerase II subunit RPB1
MTDLDYHSQHIYYSISKLYFDVQTTEEIIKNSVVEIEYRNMDGIQVLYDDRMGAPSNRKECGTCHKTIYECIGHFGHIRLCEDIIHPLYTRKLLNILKSYCMECGKRYKKKKQCDHPEPKLTLSKDGSCILDNKIPLTVDVIKSSIEKIELHNTFTSHSNPKSLIMSVLPVLPICCRIPVYINGVAHDDDLTIQYFDILKINAACMEIDRSTQSDEFMKKMSTLTFRIKCLFNNSQNKLKHVNGRAFKGIKERLGGKQGQIRMYMMGKRVNLSARTVVSAEPTLAIQEMGVPTEICNTLYFKERYNKYNHAFLEHLMRTGKLQLVIKEHVNMVNPSTINLIMNRREIVFTYEYPPEHGRYMSDTHLYIYFGDVLCRNLMDGDVVLLNRQPTLHRHSMTAMRVKVLPYRTFRFNLAITKQFNADFDGDEMNIHVPMDYDSKVELEELCSVRANVMSIQQGQNVVCLVQDSLLGSYIMSRFEYPILESYMQQVCTYARIPIEEYESMMDRIHGMNISLTSKVLISLALPRYFTWKTSFMLDGERVNVHIQDGLLLDGFFSKSLLGSGTQSIIRVVENLMGGDASLEMINRFQFICNAWFSDNGYSIGIKDCIIPISVSNHITQTVMDGLNESIPLCGDVNIDEYAIQTHLNNIKNKAMAHSHQYMKQYSRFANPVLSGAKGDFFNVAQIASIIGQQTVSGKRVLPTIDHRKRTLPHQKNESSIKYQYINSGFIRNSFFDGLTASEYFYHSMSAREGLIDTSMKTANTGYLQRKIIKVCEDVRIDHTRAVVGSGGIVFNSIYGEDGILPSSLFNK